MVASRSLQASRDEGSEGVSAGAVDSSYGRQPSLVPWINSVSSYYTEQSGGRVIVNEGSPPPAPGAPPYNPFDQEGNYRAFAFPASSLNNTAVVGIDSVDPNAPNPVAQALSLTIGDAIARNETATAADLIYQALLRRDTVETTATLLELMVQAVGCKDPLASALRGAYQRAVDVNAQSLFPSALRSVNAPIGNFAGCLGISTEE